MFNRTLLALGAAALMSSASAWADVCVAPGDIVVTDPAGDVLAPVPGNPVTAPFDLQSVAIATPPADDLDNQDFVFTIKTGGEPQTFGTPGSGVFVSFIDPRGTFRGVRADADSSGGIVFLSYTVAVDNDGEFNGQFIDSFATADGSYAADGTLTITVKAKDVGVRNTGDVLSGFNGGGIAFAGQPGAGASLNLDSMPDDQGRGAATPIVFSPCAKSLNKQGSGLLAGSMPFAGLLLMGLLALARRRV